MKGIQTITIAGLTMGVAYLGWMLPAGAQSAQLKKPAQNDSALSARQIAPQDASGLRAGFVPPQGSASGTGFIPPQKSGSVFIPPQGSGVSSARFTPPSGSGGGAVAGAGLIGPQCLNRHAVEPTLVYSSSGSTLLGPSHETLVIYDNGLVMASRMSAVSAGASVMLTKTVSTDVIDALSAQLAALGASELCDDDALVIDLPLITVTIFDEPGTDACAHTFSYYQTFSGAHAAVDQAIQDFLALEFPGF
jgi:hypothetical protein